MSVNALTARSLSVNKAVVSRYLDGLKPDEYHHQPLPGANSAAWILGHLILTERRAIAGLGVTDLPELPPDFETRYATTGQPAGDQQALPDDGPELLALFHAHRDHLIASVLAADETALNQPPSRPSPLYATAAELAAFMAQHTAMHVGQITLIRRSLGYPPVL